MSERCEILYCRAPRRFQKYCTGHQYDICRNGLKPVWAARIMKLELWWRFLFIYVRSDRERSDAYERELRIIFEREYLPGFIEPPAPPLR